MPYENILYEKTDKLAILTLNRPERLNALDQAMAEECVQALEDCERDAETRVLLITGVGRAFCAGGDVKALKEAADKGNGRLLEDLLRAVGNLCLRLRELPKPALAVINGHAAGAGFALALACDLAMASAEARFRLAFAGLGLIPDAGSTFFLPRLLGLRQASELVFLDRTLTAQEALALGLVNYVAAPDVLNEEAWAWAEKIAAGPTQALGRAKQLMQQGLSGELAAQIELEIAAQLEMGKTADHREGLAAFLEKRKPDFSGR
jgi:2-(1,2-epoxy-1,2-dihydrophenyl)acetyl-CoA isomerase